MINLMGDYMAQIHQEEGDAFPYEKARIIAELELSMDRRKELQNTRWFPRMLKIDKSALATKVSPKPFRLLLGSQALGKK